MTYARARLLLGITCVGFWVLMSSVLLGFDLPRLFNAVSIYNVIPVSVGIYAMLSFPFDVVGGYILPKRYGRWPYTYQRWFWGWLKGAVVQAALLVLLNLVLWQGLATLPLLGQILLLIVLQLVLAFFQPILAFLIGSMTPLNSAGRVQVWQSNDVGFTGGVSLTGQSIVPEKWTVSLEEAPLKWLYDRRDLLAAHPMNAFGAIAAMIFNTLGFVVVTIGFDLGYTQAGDWLTLVTGCTLWSFLGVLVLPLISQRAVLALDGVSCRQLTQAEQIAVGQASGQAIKQLDSWQDEEPARHRWIQTIFHPLPSVQQRQAVMASGTNGPAWGLWHVARRALYYSWPLMNLLNRAVHCNVGRPDLWVFLPAEG